MHFAKDYACSTLMRFLRVAEPWVRRCRSPGRVGRLNTHSVFRFQLAGLSEVEGLKGGLAVTSVAHSSARTIVEGGKAVNNKDVARNLSGGR